MVIVHTLRVDDDGASYNRTGAVREDGRLNAASPYAGQRLALVSLHGKAAAFGLPFRRHLGADVLTLDGIDTDRFGSFAGEMPRLAGPRETALAKARAAVEAGWTGAALASEGSFGPHPAFPWASCDHEVAAVVDPARGLELAVEVTSLRAVHGAAPATDADAFLARAGFPAHAVIVRAGGGVLAKGLRDRAALDAVLADAGADATIEVDLRAHMNPTRMGVIRAAAGALARRLARACPACAAPGWGVVGRLPGLPCALCGAPTRVVRATVEGCARCDARHELPAAAATADPGMCDECNP